VPLCLLYRSIHNCKPLLVQAAVDTQPVNLVAAIAVTTKSGVVPPHSKAASAAVGKNRSRNFRGQYLVSNSTVHGIMINDIRERFKGLMKGDCLYLKYCEEYSKFKTAKEA
jgi:hypothetical protein